MQLQSCISIVSQLRMARNIVFHQEDLKFQPFLQVFFISWRNYWSELPINKGAVTLTQIMLPEQIILGFESLWLLHSTLDFITRPVVQLQLEVVCLLCDVLWCFLSTSRVLVYCPSSSGQACFHPS